MVYSIILIIHILGALSLFGTVFFSFIAIILNKLGNTKILSNLLSIQGIVQVLSGALLWLSSPQQSSLLSFCSKIGVYLLVIFATKFLLVYKSKSLNIKLNYGYQQRT